MANVEEKVKDVVVSMVDDMNRSILNRTYEKDGERYLVYGLPEKLGQPYKLARLGDEEVIEVSFEELENYTRMRSNLEDY